MRKKRHFLSVLLFVLTGLFLFSCQNCWNRVTPSSFKVNGRVAPKGIDTPQPILSWRVESNKRGIAQTAYRILVASSRDLLEDDRGDLWDSGMVLSSETVGIPYDGKTLVSRQSCWWKVKIWDQDGKESSWSKPAFWSMGLLNPGDWSAQWIGLDRPVGTDNVTDQHTRVSARMLRKEIVLSQKVKNATLYVCGLGLFEYYINGKKVGKEVLSPALSEFGKRAYYVTHDVTEYLSKGDNTLGVILGNGRYCPVRPENMESGRFGFPKLIQQLEVEYVDGSVQTFISDESWKITADGPIVSNNEFDGEEYDATKEMDGWNENGFDDSSWLSAERVQAGAAKLSAQPTPPIRVMETVCPVSVREVSPGVHIYDMGQNMVGWVRLKVKGQRGERIKLRFAETLQSDSSLYLANMRSALVTDTYTLRGGGPESYEPRFTYHGFRYVELTGYPGKPDLSTIEGKVVYDEMPTTGTFETSNPVLNTVYRNAYWGIKGNYRSIPTDCPQRDERMGWLGDRAVGSIGESFVFGNGVLYAKWLGDIRDAQSEEGSVPDLVPTQYWNYTDNVTWPAAYLVVGDMIYRQFGDMTVIRNHYDSYRKWILYMRDRYMKDGIIARDIYGDWCMPPERQDLIHSGDPARKTDGAILSTTYYYHLLSLMQKFAGLLDKQEDSVQYRLLADTVYQAYNAAYLNPDQPGYGNNTATANLLSLAFGLVPEEHRDAVFERIVDKTMNDFWGHISTGLVGAQWMMRTLTANGREDIAYRLATNTDYPSWGYMAEKGATTIWELWNGDTADPAMNSGNHVMLLGDLVIWFYEDLAGIKNDPESAGFKHIIMKPCLPEGLNRVKASYNSVRGPIESEWEKQEDRFIWNITIPANTTATVYVPSIGVDRMLESGKRIAKSEHLTFVRMEGRYAVFEAGSGHYEFVSQ